MKKILNYTFLLILMITTTGCHRYISAETENGGKSYYGAFNRKDFTHADVILYEKDSDTICDGVIHLNAPSSSITFKNNAAPAVARLACSDGKLMDIDWKIRKASFDKGEGEGKDQYNTVYKFTTISKKEFKENMPGQKAKVPNKDFVLRY